MEKIGNQKIWSYFDGVASARPAANQKIRGGEGHRVLTYFDLATKVAELQFLNRDHVLLFRGQRKDYRTIKGNSSLKAQLFRLDRSKVPSSRVLEQRFAKLRKGEGELVERYASQRLLGFERLRRHRVLRWAILQHYEVCPTPLFDVTQSLRVAASFASLHNDTKQDFVFLI
jgi:hypothetical protein